MSGIEVKSIRLPDQAEAFYTLPFSIYRGEPRWVAPLLFERKEFFNPAKNPFLRQAEVQCFLAYSNGRAVGSIAATMDPALLAREPGVGLFGFFEAEDDPAIAPALWQAACAWLRARGATRVRGPCNFTQNHECGLLVEGFDDDPVLMMTWNPPRYEAALEGLGLRKAMDLLGFTMDAGPIPPSIAAISARVIARNPKLVIRPLEPSRFDQERDIAFRLYNDAWEDNWGFTKLSEAEFDKLAEGLKEMLDPRLAFVAEVDGEPAAIAITLPDYNQVIKPMRGKLLPFGWWYWLTRAKRFDRLRVFILGVSHKFQHIALGAPLYVRTWEAAQQMGVRGAEAGWVLECNHRMCGALVKLGARADKRWRIYEAALTPR